MTSQFEAAVYDLVKIARMSGHDFDQVLARLQTLWIEDLKEEIHKVRNEYNPGV